MKQPRHFSKRNGICVCSLWAKGKGRRKSSVSLMYILGFKIIIGLLLSLHNIVGLQNEKCRSGGRKCQITFKNIVLTQNEST